MKQSVTESRKEFVRGQFSSRNKDAPQTDRASGAEISVFAYLTRKDRNKFERILEKRLAIYPDALSVYRVAKIIGYSERTIRWHIAKGRLFATLQERKYLVSKYLIIIKRSEATSLLDSERAQIAPRWFAFCERSA